MKSKNEEATYRVITKFLHFNGQIYYVINGNLQMLMMKKPQMFSLALGFSFGGWGPNQEEEKKNHVKVESLNDVRNVSCLLFVRKKMVVSTH